MSPGAIRTVLLIAGMRDNRCREIVMRALEIIEGVREVDVNMFRARATVAHDAACDPTELVRAVARAGYGAAIPG